MPFSPPDLDPTSGAGADSDLVRRHAVGAEKLRSGFTTLAVGQAGIVGQWLGFDLSSSSAVRDVAGNPELGTIAFGYLAAHMQSLLATAPVVLMFDDLQWAENESLDVIGQIVDAFAEAPLLVV